MQHPGINYKESIDMWLQVPRTEWVLNWPGQLVIAGCQTYWTSEVSEALEQEDLEGYVPKLLSQVLCFEKKNNYSNNNTHLMALCPELPG